MAMRSLRGSFASIPGALSDFISTAAATPIDGASDPTLPSPPPFSAMTTSMHSDDFAEVSHAIPSSLIKEQWQLVLDQDASVDDLKTAIDRCKELVVSTNELSEERKWLVRHLVELRFRLNEIEDANCDPGRSNVRVILGHHFVDSNLKSTPKSRQHCDHCTGVIWSVVQASYICSDCNYRVHHKCVNNVARICAHITASEYSEPIDEICPEDGLAAQKYKCNECNSSLSFKPGHVEPRLCDYNGRYFCPTCHWNDAVPIPARIIHNWDFTRNKVCRASLQVLNILNERPSINLEKRNPKLFIYVQNLSLVKKLRTNLNDMRRYLCECRIATSSKIIENAIGHRRHLIQNVDMYSIADLIEVENGAIVEFLNRAFAAYEQHIRKCQLCTGKGYVCEVCRNVEVLFPFDDGAVGCKVCGTVYHRACWLRKNQKCPRCVRIEQRKSQLLEQIEDDTLSD